MKFIRDILAALIVAIVGTTAALLAHLLKVSNELIVYYVTLLGIVFTILAALWVKSYFDKDKGDQNTLITFFIDELLPNKCKRFLGLESHIVVIEDKASPSIYENFRKQFPRGTEFVKKHFLADSSDVEEGKTLLKGNLSGAKSVIVVRTKELEKNDWVYEILLEWSVRHSDVPCLILDRIDPEEAKQLRLNPIPEKYYFIHNESAVGWRLLKRTNERGFSWRHQAQFNRAVALSFLILLLLGSLFSYLIISSGRNQHATELGKEKGRYQTLESSDQAAIYRFVRTIYDANAKQIRDEIKQTTKIDDTTLNVSYWFRYEDTLYQSGTTEDERVLTNYPVDQIKKRSVIGCGFVHRNSTVGWHYKTNTNKTEIWAINREPVADDINCRYDNLPHKKMKSIVCSSYGFDDHPLNTVGICAFTNNESYVLTIPLLERLLVEKAKEFHNTAFDLLKNKKLVPPSDANALPGKLNGLLD